MHPKISEAERVWLTDLFRRVERGEPIDRREMMVKLRTQLPEGFLPGHVNPVFLGSDSGSALALFALNPDNKILADVEKVILATREILIAEPNRVNVTSEEISKALGFHKLYAARVLELLGSAGNFTSGGGGPADRSNWEISIDREENLAEFLQFKDLKSQIAREFSRQAAIRSPRLEFTGLTHVAPFVPDTAFILMQIDRSNPGLEDVLIGIKESCHLFGIKATRADEIEHQDQITQIILDAIQKSEYLIADLSGERQNVYYEVGYSHALRKKPILVRRVGTQLHFDLKVHNVPEYENVTQLRQILERRLESMTGRISTRTPSRA